MVSHNIYQSELIAVMMDEIIWLFVQIVEKHVFKQTRQVEGVCQHPVDTFQQLIRHWSTFLLHQYMRTWGTHEEINEVKPMIKLKKERTVDSS